MAQEKIDLKKKVYNKFVYPTIINTRFNELGVTSINTQIQETTTVEQFFEYYNELFYEIPPLGEINSHQYLVQTSGDYINLEPNQEEIEALQREITQLRKDLLQAQVDLVEAQTGQKVDIDLDAIDEASFGDPDQFSQIVNNLDVPPTAENTTAQSIVSNTPTNPNTSISGTSSGTGGGSGGGGY